MLNITLYPNATHSFPIAPLSSIYAWFLCTTSISIVGAIASTLLIIVISKQKSQRLRSRLLICQMLFHHFLMIAVYAPTDSIIVFRYQLGCRDPVACTAVVFFRQTNIGATYWSSCAVSLNSLTAAYFPHQHKVIFSEKKTMMYNMICWLVPAAIYSVSVTGVVGRAFWGVPMGMCGSRPVLQPLHMFLDTFLAISFPLGVQGLAHILLAVKLMRKGHGHAHPGQPETSKKRHRQVVLARILILSYIWYLICFLPIPIIKPFLNKSTFYRGHEMMVLGLKTVELCGSVGTPIIFFLLGADYQATLKRMVHGFRDRTSQLATGSSAFH